MRALAGAMATDFPAAGEGTAQDASGPTDPEHARFISRGGEQLYVVTHGPRGVARGSVLLAGPFGLERTHAYSTWVRWARLLASDGYRVLRFDFRGTGESTGAFAEMGFHEAAADLREAFGELRALDPIAKVTLLGLRFGALLAATEFANGLGDAALLWDPPMSGRDLLLEALRRKVATDYAHGVSSAGRATRDAYVVELERGGFVEVDGYTLSGRHWCSAGDVRLALPVPSERPWHVIHLDGRPIERAIDPGHATSLILERPPFWLESKRLRANVSVLFDASLAWLARVHAS